MPPALIGAALLATSTVATGISVYSGRKAASLEKKQQGVEFRMQQVETRRKQMEQLARARALRASVVNVAEQTGTGTSSTTAGTGGAVVSSAAGNIGYLQSGLESARLITRLNSQQLNATNRQAVLGAVADVAGVFGEALGGYEELAGLFGG